MMHFFRTRSNTTIKAILTIWLVLGFALTPILDAANDLHAVEHGDQLIFMQAVKAGPANRSFRLQVAALVGLPKTVLNNAKQVLARLENKIQTPLNLHAEAL